MTDAQIDRWYAAKSDEWDMRLRQLRTYRIGFAATSVLFMLFFAFLSRKGLLP